MTSSTDKPDRKQPETLRLRTAIPSLTVSDLEASLAWYRDVMGFMLADEWKDDDGVLRGVMVRAGAIEFMLGQDDFAKGRDRPKGVGFRLYCQTAQDIDAVAAAIESRGGVLDHPPTDQPWGGREFAVVDPDGFKITVARWEAHAD